MAGLLAAQYRDEDAARAHVEKMRWPDGPVCPHCGSINDAYKLTAREGSKNPGRKGLYKCKGCSKQFSVLVDSIFSDSHIPLHKWLLAIHLMCSSKKGISAHQLMRNLELGSYRTAWFMGHRIRWAMTQTPMTELLKGIVEVDETYMGGKEKGKPGFPGPNSKKTPVLALLERGGNVHSFPLERATLKNIKPIVQEHVDPSTHLMTDESPIYYMMKPMFAQHSTVNHAHKEYARKEENFTVTTNTIESFFVLLKRSNYGIHHHMSRKYMASYCAERDFVYNCRKLDDNERAIIALKGTAGKRLMLKNPKGS